MSIPNKIYITNITLELQSDINNTELSTSYVGSENNTLCSTVDDISINSSYIENENMIGRGYNFL